jgi:transposase-like protein
VGTRPPEDDSPSTVKLWQRARCLRVNLRNRQAAKRLFRKKLKGLRYVPRVLITDKLKSYGAAKAQIMPGVEHLQHKVINNCAEISHQPTGQRERRMRRFESPCPAQRFLSAHGPDQQSVSAPPRSLAGCTMRIRPESGVLHLE